MKNDKKNIIGTILKEYRLKNGYTQEEFSELTGLAPRYISQIERGLSNGSLETLIKFCDAYKITPNHLLANFLEKPENCTSYNSIANYEKLSPNNKYIVDRLIEILLNLQENK